MTAAQKELLHDKKLIEDRIAVVFIHGQGEQRPMEDVQELARTVWSADPARTRKSDGGVPNVFLTPDANLDLADLGRVTTEAREHDARVDFYELYWAHLMTGNKLSHLADWFRRLQSRPRKEAPAALLPVRQTVIRLMESLTLLCVVFIGLVALLTPPAATGLDRETIEGMWRAVSFNQLPQAWLAGMIGPDDFIVWLGVAAVIALGAAVLRLFLNEIRNGAGERKTSANPEKIINRDGRRVFMQRNLTRLAGLMALLILTMIVLQGPFADWSDLRVVLLLLAIGASVLLFSRNRMEAALVIALGGAAAALATALFGGLGDARAIMVGANAAPPAWLFVGVDASAATPAHYVLRPEFADGLALGAMAVALFAGLWFIGGLLRSISAARTVWVRLPATLITMVGGFGLAVMVLQAVLAAQPLHWVIYALGVTILIVVGAASVMFALASAAFLVPVMADSARYFSREPAHIGARQRIRQAGIKLLERLHSRPADQGGYSRVIIVAHSLGSAVGYELLIDFWGRRAGDLRIANGSALDKSVIALQAAAHQLNASSLADRSTAFDAYRAAQTALQDELLRYSAATDTEFPTERTDHTILRSYPRHWLITDFITLGSPLTYASLLMADSPANLLQRFSDRSLSACPPILFDQQNAPCLYRDGSLPETCDTAVDRVITFLGFDSAKRFAHHACFAPVRWTNHYFPVSGWIAEGDVIGGPLGPAPGASLKPGDQGVMGRGVLDKPLERRHTGALFAHNEYWRSRLPTAILRKTLAPDTSPRKPKGVVEQIQKALGLFKPKTPEPLPMHIAALIGSMALDEKLQSWRDARANSDSLPSDRNAQTL